MNLEITKDCSLYLLDGHTPTGFSAGQEIEINDHDSNIMIKLGVARLKKTKETLIKENKAIESVEENKVSKAVVNINPEQFRPVAKRRGRPPKINPDVVFEKKHIPLPGQGSLDL